ncbi:MAG: tetratricopeptide repeat protein [Pirellulaceae bacterium]
MRNPVLLKTLTWLVAFAMAPCPLWSSESSSKAETTDSVDAAKSDSENETTSEDRAAPPDANPARPFVYLDKSARNGRKTRNLTQKGLLHQELYRQAFLLAAREECGAVTRDARLKDPMSAEGGNLPFALASTEFPESDQDSAAAAFKLKVRRGLPDKRKEKVAQLGLAKAPERGKLKTSLIAAEELSRGRFKEILEQEGFAAKDRPHSQHPVPEEVKTRLEDLVFTSQFAAIRQLHDLIRRQGESPFLLGALVRGYANLGVLTELYWAPAHKVFKARALLYAQRMLTTGDDECWARWHRAYAFALTGIPISVVEDLQTAAQRRDQARDGETVDPPAWVGVIDAYGQQDISGLKADNFQSGIAPLAHLMRFELIKQCGGAQSGDPRLRPAALEAADALPNCYRFNQAVCRYCCVVPLHEATKRGNRLLGKRLYLELLGMPGLPPAARTICQTKAQKESPLARLFGAGTSDTTTEFSTRRRLMQVLLGETTRNSSEDAESTESSHENDATKGPAEQVAADKGELSWANLGHLIREISFLNVWQRTRFLRYMLGVPPEDFIERSEPLVADHPYRLALDAMAWDPKEKDAAQRKAATGCDWDDMEPQAAGILDILWDGDDKMSTPVLLQMIVHFDITMNDLRHMCFMPYLEARSFPNIIDFYLAIHPRSPSARCLQLEYQWDEYKDKAAVWAKEYSDLAVVQSVVGKQLLAKERYEEAIKYLKAAIELQPSRGVYLSLAKAYDGLGQEDKWFATMKEYLELPNLGLSQYRFREKIALRLRLKGQWEEALPYAEEAASSYASYGLLAAARCHEGLGNWEKANDYYKANANRYPHSGYLPWYLFCRRTGKGNVKPVRERVQQQLENPAMRKAERYPSSTAAFYVLEDNLKKAVQIYEKVFHEADNPYYGLHAALIADELGQTERRDTALRRIVDKGPECVNAATDEPQHNEIRLAELFRQDLAEGGRVAFNIETARTLHPDDSRHDQPNVDYFLAKYLELRGKEDLAIELWQQCMVSNVFLKNRTLACGELIRRGHEPIAPADRSTSEKAKDIQMEKAGELDSD